jgi:hypothetical protein
MIKRTKTRAGTAKKTTFTLSAQAVEAIDYTSAKLRISVRMVLDRLAGLLTPASVGTESIFLKLTMDAVGNNSEEQDIKKSWSVSPRTIDILKKTSAKQNVSRNLLLDHAIRVYRQIIDYEHPAAKEELRKLKDMLEDLQPQRLAKRYGIDLHYNFLPLSSTDEHLFDLFYDSVLNLQEAVQAECQQVFGDD